MGRHYRFPQVDAAIELVRIEIDPSRCSGHGRCYDVAPSLFTDDERGYGQVIGDGVVADDQLQTADDAVRACPERAIRLVARTEN